MAVITRELMAKMDEATLRREVVIPLLQKLAYQGVNEAHGVVEFGKDILAWKADDLNTRENTAIVAKATRISGKGVEEVARQVRLAFQTTYKDSVSSETQSVHRVWVVTNKAIPEISRQSLTGDLPEYCRRYTRVIDGDELWNLWKENFPVELVELLEDVQTHLQQPKTRLKPRVWIESDSKGVELKEAYPGQTQSEPFEGTIAFKFPDTPEGKLKAEELERAWKTGAPASIPGEFVRQFGFEEADLVLRDLLGIEPGAITNLEISTARNPNPAPVRIEFFTPGMEPFALEYVDWRLVQAGKSELTLSNEEQPIPIRVEHVMKLDEGIANFRFTLKSGPVAAVWWHHWIELQKRFSEPTEVKITMVENGATLSIGHRDAGDYLEYPSGWCDAIANLAEIQRLLGQPIFIPEEPLTEQDTDVISRLRHALLEPIAEGTWDKIGLAISTSDAQAVLDRFTNGASAPLNFGIEEKRSIGGHEFSIGSVHYSLESARLINEQEVNSLLANVEESGPELEMHFEPGDNNKGVFSFLAFVRHDEEGSSDETHAKET